MPVQILYVPPRVVFSFEKCGDEIIFRGGTGKILQLTDPKPEPYRVREMFLGAKTPGEAIEFLSCTGFFLYPEQSDLGYAFSMTWVEFQQWQELILLTLTEGFLKRKEPLEIKGIQRWEWDVSPGMYDLLSRLKVEDSFWLTGRPVQIGIEPRGSNLNPLGGEGPVAVITAGNTLQAILATIFLDGLNDISHAYCELKDCGELYAVTSKHARAYCSQACAHKAYIRRGRAAKAQAKAKSTKSSKHKRGTRK